MNGVVKSVLAAMALWIGAGVAWLVIVGIAATAAGPGLGSAVYTAMRVSWAAALVLAVAAVVFDKVLFWRWLPTSGTRIALLVVAALVHAGTALAQAFSVFVIFNR